ncbi:MAG: hypothetical protein K6B65_06905 [Bacilli bacterium]|nr:hypothetical protein [Bacilli bacterium]
MIVDGIIEKIAGLTVEQRLNLARNSYAELMERLSDAFGDENAVTAFVTFVKVFVSADKVCSEEEYQLFKLITGCDWDVDTFYEITNGGSDPEVVKMVDAFIDSLDEDSKIPAVVLAVSFMAIDGKVTQSERALLQKIYD